MTQKKSFILMPLLIVAVAALLIWLTGAWQFAKWLPPTGIFQKGDFDISSRFYGGHESSDDLLIGLLDVFSKPTNREAIKRFVDDHPDNAEYNFGWVMFGGDKAYLHKAEQLDPDNPLYPYWLGLLYAKNPSGHIDNELIPDSALAAFDRARKLEPNNAAIDLASMEILIEQTDDTILSSYRQKRGYRNGKHDDPSTIGFYITEQGREVMRSAMTKSEYRGHGMEAAYIGLRLLEDSGQNTFFSRTEYLYSCPIPRFMAESRAVKLFVKDIGSFENKADIEAVADTLIDLAHIGFLMSDDPGRTVIQHLIGMVLTSIVRDLLGDLYLVNNLPSSERVIGEWQTEAAIWKVLWSRSAWRGIAYDLTPTHLTFLLIGAVAQAISIIMFLLFIIGFIGMLIKKPIVEAISVKKAAFWSTFITILLIGVLILSVAISSADELGKTIFTFIPIAILVLGVALLIIRYAIKKLASRLGFVLSIVFIISGLILILVPVLNSPYVLLLYIPLGLILGIFKAIHDKKEEYKAFWPMLEILAIKAFVFFALILLISWAFAGPQLKKFMEMREANMMTEIIGPGAEMPGSYSRGAHFIPNDGAQSSSHLDRLQRLEEMFGPISESGE